MSSANNGVLQLFCFVLPLLSTVLAASSRSRPVVMPFAQQYGVGSSSSWFSVPLTVGNTDFNLSISTSLSRTWIPGSSLCSKSSNKTLCEEPMGGLYSASPSWNVIDMTSELVEGVYNTSLSEKLVPAGKTDSKTLLGLHGKGVVSTDKMTLKSKTGIIELDSQSVGVFTTEKPAFNGLLSLQGMAFGLFGIERIPGPNFHLYLGASAESNGSSVPDVGGYEAGKYTLIFGGYDQRVWNLNKTQQYPLRRTITSGKQVGKKDLPASAEVGYRMEAMLNDIIYRWTEGGDTDNSLLSAPSTAIIDTNTPYMWLPQKSVDALVAATGAKWNESMDSYVFTRCFGSECSDAETSSQSAKLDFVFPSQTVTISFPDFFKLQSLWYDSLWTENRPVFPIRALKDENAPIILGRAVMAGVHLWVDYAEEYFGLKAANTSWTFTPEVVGWSKDDHPPITNKTILATSIPDGTSPSNSSTSSSSSTGNNSGNNKKPPLGLIAGAVGGSVILLLAIVIFFCFAKKRNSKRPVTQVINGPQELHNVSSPTKDIEQKSEYYQLQEMEGGVYPLHPAVLPPNAGYEMPHEPRYEMHGVPQASKYEMPAAHGGGYNHAARGYNAGQTYHEMPAGNWGTAV
ncbi:aspartic peptidase domain-containing protein [Trichophaea hybrida]|nr:aspartic peptidase domain-containing protein [Trichophaea hybrida]